MLRKRSRTFGGKQSFISDPQCPLSSILEIKNFSTIGNLLSFTRHLKKPPFETSVENGGSRAVGLAIVDALNDEKGGGPGGEKSSVLFGSSKLKIQVPSVVLHNLNSASEVPTSPIEFGIKNRDSQLALLSPSAQRSSSSPSSPHVFIERISASEMELSEDYTCVIIHGPNPKTTHIFNDCILEICGGDFVVARKENSALLESERGKKAFCSNG